MEWVIQMKNEIQNTTDDSLEMNYWGKRFIYRLPDHVTDVDNKAYKPQVVSLGPYHHGEERLKRMEDHKHRSLIHFMKRSQAPLDDYWKALAQVVHFLKDAYDQLDHKWLNDTNAFLKLMILDGCFILEILRNHVQGLDEYAPDDPIFSNHGKLYILPFLRRDMLLLENQVHLLVLQTLLRVENKVSEPREYLNKHIQRLYKARCPLRGTCLHLLDVYRWSLLHQDRPRFRKRCTKRSILHYEVEGDGTTPSAAELDEAGIRFKKSKTKSLRDITFRGNTLRLPEIIVDEETKSKLLNLIAFELHHVGARKAVTSYTYFLENLVKDSKDVSLLRSSGIIINALGSDEDVAELFNLLRRDMVVDPESSLHMMYRKVSAKLRHRFRKRLHEWRTDLVQNYFRSPWKVLSVIAAVLLLALTIIQTVYSVLSYDRRN